MLLMIIFGILLFLIFWVWEFDNERQTPTYEDLLLMSEWKTKRDCILKRDDYKCQWCGKQENLQVHHKYYSKYPNNIKVQPWNYPNDALITLCDECHQKAHKKKIKVYYRSYTDNY